jgi:hypothetical protein
VFYTHFCIRIIKIGYMGLESWGDSELTKSANRRVTVSIESIDGTKYIKEIVIRGWCKAKYAKSWGVEYRESKLIKGFWQHDNHVSIVLDGKFVQMEFSAAEKFANSIVETIDAAQRRREGYSPFFNGEPRDND